MRMPVRASQVGLPGGIRIFTSVLQAVINVIDHKMSPQEAVEAPRMWTQGAEVQLERTFPSELCVSSILWRLAFRPKRQALGCSASGRSKSRES